MSTRGSNYAPKQGGRASETLSAAEKFRRGTLRIAQRAEEARLAMGEVREPEPSSQDYVRVAEGYVTDVLSGAVPACEWVKLACQRQQRDRARQDWAYVWDEAWAVRACQFLEKLPHVEGKWTTPNIRLEPSQVFLVTCLFGWRHRSDPAIRRFTVLYYELGRKGAKSTLMAGIALFHMVEEDEPGAAVVLGATTGSQARIVFGIMQGMIKKSAWLRHRGFEAFANAIITPDGSAKPINAKASTQDGLNPSLICLDESHAQDFGLHDVLKSAQGARRNPLLLAPTTAGYDLLSVGYALRSTLCKVLQGVFESEHFLGMIYTLDEGDDWREEAAWKKANPMLGITPTLEWVRTYCTDAKQTEGLEGEFRVKVCSQWSQSATTWLSMTKWDACAEPALRLESFHGQQCWMGADMAQKDDLAAVALLFERGPDVVAFVRFYLPNGVVEERARRVPEYRAWVKAGLVTPTEGTMIDEALIEDHIRGWCRQFNVVALRFDQFGSAGIVSRLAKDGFKAAILDKNAKNMTPPAMDLETRVRHQRFKHDGNSCLKWMASNTVVERRVNDSLMPKKERHDSPNKIDGIDAILQADSARLTPMEAPVGFQLFVLGR